MDLTGVNIDQLLHELRTAQLRRVPKGADVFLSAGCSGRWYFDWVAQSYGPVAHHIGIEFYSPEPDDLPPGVTWIANTVGDMHAVKDDSVDLVFSGQNIEHLWADDIAGFLVESNRVLTPGGRLVIDSPNRDVTAPLRWHNPQHTIELTPTEAVELVELAGFKVDTLLGLWRCLLDGELRPLPPADEIDLARRTIGGLDAPDDSFIWWLEATKAGAADRAGLGRRLDAIFAAAWNERINRLVPMNGDLSPDGTTITSPLGSDGPVFFGPYAPLPAGIYSATFGVTAVTEAAQSPGWCDVMADEQQIAVEHLPPMAVGETAQVTIPFAFDQQRFGTQFRLISNGTAQLRSPFKVTLTPPLDSDRGNTQLTDGGE